MHFPWAGAEEPSIPLVVYTTRRVVEGGRASKLMAMEEGCLTKDGIDVCILSQSNRAAPGD